MKTLGLCLLLVPYLLAAASFSQQPITSAANSTTSADDAIVQLWNAHAGQSDRGWLEGDKLIISSDSDLQTCLYLRVYRVKRETKQSDVTIPSGYTTCVPTNRFEKRSAVEPKLHLALQQ